MSAEAPPTTAPPAPSVGRRQPWRLLVASELVVALMAGAILVGHWWTHPEVFADSGAAVSVDPRPVERATFHFGVAEPDEDGGAVTVKAARPIYAKNTAGSVVSFAVCRLGDNGGIGAVRSLKPFCTEVMPIDGSTELDLGSGDETLVMTVKPTERGRTRVTSVIVEYTTGRFYWWRRGEQAFRVDVMVKAR